MKKLVSIGLAVAWLAPSAATLILALHLAFDHHPAPSIEHQQRHRQLASIATHGHHHDAEATPAHDHGGRLDAEIMPRTSRAPQPHAWLASLARPATRTGRLHLEARQRTGPSTALFTAHCSLLL